MSNEPHMTENPPSPAPPGAAGEPVFVHCMLRTGSTFVFGRFRNNERYRCFFEPLNEGLATLSERMIDHYSGPLAAKRMRHVEMELPYYEEYRPFRRWWGGVRGYPPGFAYHDFFREHGEALAKYFRMLLASAAAEGRQAMFKLCRSYGRLGAMRREFSGQHAYLFRNPRDQWQSYMLKGRPYWMAMTCVIAALRPGPASDLSARLSRPLPKYLRQLALFRAAVGRARVACRETLLPFAVRGRHVPDSTSRMAAGTRGGGSALPGPDRRGSAVGRHGLSRAGRGTVRCATRWLPDQALRRLRALVGTAGRDRGGGWGDAPLSIVRGISGISFQLAMERSTASWKLTPRKDRSVIFRTV